MVNLVPAICPCCGGQLELDDNMKRAECKYCKSTIIVDEAIEKFKTDSQGNLKISGIKDQDQLLDEANKYFKAQDYKKALNRYDALLNLDTFNPTLITMKIKCMINIIGDISVYDRKLKTGNEEAWIYGYALKEMNSRINTLNKVNNSKEQILDELGEKNLNKIRKIVELVNSNNVNSSSKDANNYVSMINNCINNYKKFAQENNMEKVLRFFNKIFELNENELSDNNLMTLSFKTSMDKTNYSECWELCYTLNNNEVLKTINTDKFNGKLNNLYDSLNSNYEQWENEKIIRKLNDFIFNSNIFNKNKKIKYLATFFGIEYTNGLEFTKIKNKCIYYKVKVGFNYEEKPTRKDYSIEKIEKYLNEYK